MAITSKSFGATSKGEEATLFTITNENGFILEVTDFGATWVSAKIPTKHEGDCFNSPHTFP